MGQAKFRHARSTRTDLLFAAGQGEVLCAPDCPMIGLYGGTVERDLVLRFGRFPGPRQGRRAAPPFLSTEAAVTNAGKRAEATLTPDRFSCLPGGGLRERRHLGIGRKGGAMRVPVGRLLVGVGQCDHICLAPIRAADLQAIGRPVREKPQGTVMVGRP